MSYRMTMTLVRTPRENPSVAQGIEFSQTGGTAHPIATAVAGWAGAPGRGVWTNMKNSRPLPLGSRAKGRRIPISGTHMIDITLYTPTTSRTSPHTAASYQPSIPCSQSTVPMVSIEGFLI